MRCRYLGLVLTSCRSTLCVIWLYLEPTHIAWEACLPGRRITIQGLSPTCFSRFKRPSDTARWSIH